jgi:hypothetical protein
MKKLFSFIKKICGCIFGRKDNNQQNSGGDNSPNIKGSNVKIMTTKGDNSPLITGGNNVYKK